jgi:hypothetical protein
MNNDSNSRGDKPKVIIPDPDLDNITVLTNNLPNKPILPWNRYDSDWDENLNQDIDTDNSHNSEEE